TPNGKFIYATSFRFGTVDVFDSHFDLVNSFTDPTIPAGFAPFGIHNIGGKLYVTFAKQGVGKADDAARPGNGFVDVFAPNRDLRPLGIAFRPRHTGRGPQHAVLHRRPQRRGGRTVRDDRPQRLAATDIQREEEQSMHLFTGITRTMSLLALAAAGATIAAGS